MNDCPYCDEEVELGELYTFFECPFCEGMVYQEFDVGFDGENEHQYYWLEKLDDKKKRYVRGAK